MGADTESRINTLNTIIHHRLMVQRGMQQVTQEMERRALIHDESKFREDEFEGFARINAIARSYPYGSEEYRASLKAEKPTIHLHYQRNPHHPECHPSPQDDMDFLDVIEMVVDWYAAWKVYDGQRKPEDRTSWVENVRKQRERFLTTGMISREQWWLVEQVAGFLVGRGECGGRERAMKRFWRMGWLALDAGPKRPYLIPCGIGNAREKWSASHLWGRFYLVAPPKPYRVGKLQQPRWVAWLRGHTSQARRRRTAAARR
jgi:hypothetical protein